MLRNFLTVIMLSTLCACAQSPYFPGKSAADVPAHVDVVFVKDMYMSAWGATDTKNPTADPGKEVDPSQNDQEVMALAKANILSQITNFGYSVSDDAAGKADVAMSFFVYYQPERWPLIDRSVSILGKAYDQAGTPLFKVAALRANSAGLIGALVGPSRDDMVSAASREAVVKLVEVLRKGTKETAAKPVVAAPPEVAKAAPGASE